MSKVTNEQAAAEIGALFRERFFASTDPSTQVIGLLATAAAMLRGAGRDELASLVEQELLAAGDAIDAINAIKYGGPTNV